MLPLTLIGGGGAKQEQYAGHVEAVLSALRRWLGWRSRYLHLYVTFYVPQGLMARYRRTLD